VSGISIIFGSVGVLLAETNDPSLNIKTLGHGVWWAITTVSTVGYGDYYPVTALGKVVGLFVMFVGLVFLTTFTWVLSSTLVMRRFGPKVKNDDCGKKLMDGTKEFVKDKIDQVKTLFMVVKSLNDKGKKINDIGS
jgi:voltage-gated potassium channel